MPDNHAGEDKTQSFVTISPGAVVSRYRIVEKIGAGGMGEVYLAEDSTLHRKLALKFLPQHLVSDENFRTRFLREAQAAAALNHPNIIIIYEISEFENRLFMAIEFVDGQSLAEMLEENVPDFATTLEIIVQVCSGLQKAHQGGIVHRDIKPGNIMVSRDGHVKILDFGLARAEQDTQLTQAGTTLGTASNMSPEQGQGLEADQRSDVFSVGTVLYELLTGHSPFKRVNIPATIHAVVHEEPEPLARYTATVPEGMQAIIDKTLAKDRVERYQSIADLIMDLKRLQSGMQVQQSFMSQTVLVQPAVKTLAVLYLRNLGSADDEFLCYGITEDLIVDLTRIGSMRVASMRSILKFKDLDEDLHTIARQLNVNLILDGSIHKSDKAIRVSAQLVDVISGDNLWAERWEEAPENLPQIKQALAQEISRALEVDKTVVQAAQVGSPEAKNHEAYELYLRGKYAFDHKKEKSDVETALELYQQAMAVEASFLAARSGIAEILIYKGEYKQANRELNLALSDARQWDQRADEASLLRLLARSYCLSSQWDEARQQANLALEISKGLGDLAGEAEAIGLLIEVFLRRAKFDEALPLFQRVVQINQMLDDQDKGAEALKNMGNVHFRKGEYNRARALYERALGIARRRENILLQAKCIANVGLVCSHTGQLDEAQQSYEQALQIYDHLEDRAGQAISFNNLALVYSARGQYRASLDIFEKAAGIHKGLGDRANFALVRSNQGRLKAILGEFDEAIAFCKEAIIIAGELDYPFVMNIANDSLGYANWCKGEFEQAREYYRKAQDVAEKAELRREVGLGLANLGVANYYLDEYDLCRDQCARAQKHAKELGEALVQVRTAVYLAALTVHDGLFADGAEQLRKALTDVEKFGDPRYILEAQRLLGQLLMDFGVSSADREEGRTLLEKSLALAEEKKIAYEINWIKGVLG